jgi:bidirectional [NiFe] hydrogenase diaphorase subunit
MKNSTESQAKKKPPNPKDHPSGDDRFKAIDRTMKRFKYEKDALVEVLHTTQETFGFLSEDLLIYISSNLRVPMSQVYGVATFYHLFTFEPLGKHNCIICTGTACHVKGSEEIVRALSQRFDVKVGSTTDDGLFSLSTARCLGSCGIAPVVVLDGRILGKVMAEAMVRTIDDVLMGEGENQSRVEASS